MAKNCKLSAATALALGLAAMSLSGCLSTAESHESSPEASQAESHAGAESHAHKIVVTTPVNKDVITTQRYVCQIHACKHIEIRALEGGYLKEIPVNEGQVVTKGDLMFQILPILYDARLEAERAEAQRIEIELNNAQSLNNKGFVSPQEIALKSAELKKAKAKVLLAQAEKDFASVTAPFDGIVDRQHHQLGSLISEGDVLTTFSDISLMWVYFNVPEARYLQYKADLDKGDSEAVNLQIELELANGKIFPQSGKIGAIEADFNNMTGNIPFRADFPNPDRLLRNGQTGTILIHRSLKNVVVIPQRATFEILHKRYAYVVDEGGIVHQRDITIECEQDDIFVIREGLKAGEKIIFEGIRQVRDGDKIEFEFRDAEEIMNNLKYHAE